MPPAGTDPDTRAARSSSLPVALVDLDAQPGEHALDAVRLTWSPSLAALVPDARWRTLADLVAAMVPAEADTAAAALATVADAGGPVDCRFRLAADRPGRWLRLQATPDGTQHWVGTLSDVTALEEQRLAAIHERRRVDDVLDLVPGFVYETVVPPDGPERFTYVQRRTSLSGQDLAPLFEDADSWIQMLHPDDREAAWQANQRANETGDRFEVSYRVHTQDGGWMWLLDTAQSRLDEDGNRVWAGFIQDITERYELERAREVHVRRLVTLLERMQATVYEVGSDRELTYISPGPVCGHPSQLFHDDPAYWRRIVHPDDVEFAAGGLRRGFEGHGEVVQDLRVLRPDGTLAWARNHLVPYVEADGSRTWIGIVLDITGLKEAEETAHVASQQLRLAVEHAGVVPYAYRSGEARTEPGGTGWPLTVHPDDAAGFGAAHERAERAGNQVSAEFRHLAPDGGWRWALARASRVPGTAAGERPWVSGLLVDTTADHALREQRDRVHARLTARELDVFWLLGTGATNREIADALVISPHTAVRHVTQVLAKLELPNRSAVAALADRLREDSGE